MSKFHILISCVGMRRRSLLSFAVMRQALTLLIGLILHV